ncbi:MAG: sugar ABC transporter permease [Lachnospiraceae bacterium]|nr:sugar ABC transporter permease [Lachnospiraceae bacterium]
MKSKTKDRIYIICFLIIPVTLLVLFSYYPLTKLIQLSFTSWNGMSRDLNYVGIRNYQDIFSQKELFQTFGNNMAYVITALIQQVAGLFLAILLNSNIKMKTTFRAILFMPYIINGVAVAFMFNYMYDYSNSPINFLLNKLGVESVHFISNSYMTNFALSFISFWKYVGWTMVIYIAALQSIPGDVYEAARIDGAGFFQTVRYITLPNIKTMLEVSLLLSLNGALQVYFEPFLITKGGPNGRTATFISKSLELAYNYSKYGKAAAMGVILLIIILILVAVQNAFLKGDK